MRNAILLITARRGTSRMATTQFLILEVRVGALGQGPRSKVQGPAGFRVQRLSTDELQQVRPKSNPPNSGQIGNHFER